MASKKTSSRKRSRPIEPKTKGFVKNKLFIGLVILIIAIAGISAIALTILNDNEESNGGDEKPYAIIDTTKGTIVVELFIDKVPNTCDNFIKLANDGFYNDMIFHRISDNFMIQAGYLYSDGSTQVSPYGNIEFEYNETALHVDGAISMASTGSGVGGSSQFFICDGAQPFLDGSYAVFGVTVEGINVVREIASAQLDPNQIGQDGSGPPLEEIKINSIKIEYR